MSWNSGPMLPENNEPSEPGEEDVRFSAVIAETAGLNLHVRALLVRECTDFIARFSGEWLNNIENIESMGFEVKDDGELVCTRQHFRKGSEKLGKLLDFPNLMGVGQAIMTHNINVTHKDEQETNAPFSPVHPAKTFRNGSTCGPDCPTHAHNHYRKMT